MHLAALIVYAGGILFGCVWSIVAWGQLWQWDPREAFALFTLGIAVIWYASTTNHETNSVKETFRHTTTATISFWMIVLMFILGGIYAARLHSYGFPSPIPTVISILFLCNLVLLATSYWWRLRQISSTPP